MKRFSLSEFLEAIRGGLIVSCQAYPGEPLYGRGFMVGMAVAAKLGGAVGVRANGWRSIRAIKARTGLPVIGLVKRSYPGYEPYITPTLREAREVVRGGGDVVALDATRRTHPGGLSAGELIGRVKEELGVPVLADISTLEEGVAAEEAGADLVATTLSGYTPYTPRREEPDFTLLEGLVGELRVPVVAEGHIWTPEQARRALELGAYAVVVGSAITRPWLITARFVKALKARAP